MRFTKYHAIGNDYIVLDPADIGDVPATDRIVAICRRNFGVGSDGILFGPTKAPGGGIGVRIFNPDGSEAEKSGNGLRIFARYLRDRGIIGPSPTTVSTLGGDVVAAVDDDGASVTVEMGTVSFHSEDIPVTGPPRAVLNETITVLGRDLRFCAATIGNPHCVVLCDEVSPEDARTLGPPLETDPRFPNRTNVQFMQVIDRSALRIEIWERGAGYTLASGSSSCAAAAVARKLDLCDRAVTVHMPGGRLSIEIDDAFSVSMTGPVTKVCEGEIDREVL